MAAAFEPGCDHQVRWAYRRTLIRQAPIPMLAAIVVGIQLTANRPSIQHGWRTVMPHHTRNIQIERGMPALASIVATLQA